MKSKIIAVLIAIFVIISFIAQALSAEPITRIEEKIIFGAHRGDSINHTENTIPAFQSALSNSKYKFIEFDVQYTKDKIPIVHHDKSLLRLQQKTYKIPELTYEELTNISDYHIPTYEEVMNLLAGKKPLNIEIKSQGNTEDDKKLADFIIQDCENRGILDSTLISSISSDIIIYIENLNPDIQTGKIYYFTESTFFRFDSFIEELYNENANYLMLHGCNIKNYSLLKKLLPKDKTLVFWYFTDEMYVVKPKQNSWMFNLKFDEVNCLAKKECIWWC